MKKHMIINLILGIILSLLIIMFQTKNYSIHQNELELQKNDSISVMVFDEETESYVKQNAIPVGDYAINEEKTYCLNGGTVSDYDSSSGTIKYIFSGSAKCYIYFDIVEETAADYITSLLASNPTTTAAHDPDGNVRYVGTSPNNYITFNNEVWRIIGVFNDKLKIIRANSLPVVLEDNGTIVGGTSEYVFMGDVVDSVNVFYWDSAGSNNWATSSLKKYLNGTYYNGINAISKNMISQETWYFGGFTAENYRGVLNGEQYYNTERSNSVFPGNDLSVSAKIGLLYLSDYIYAVHPSVELNYNSFDVFAMSWGESWMMIQSWTLNSFADDGVSVIGFHSSGGSPLLVKSEANYMGADYVRDGYPNVHPVLYLNEKVKITGGDGSSGTPYTIEM